MIKFGGLLLLISPRIIHDLGSYIKHCKRIFIRSDFHHARVVVVVVVFVFFNFFKPLPGVWKSGWNSLPRV